MKYLVPLALLASPAAAHSGAHAHPHGAEGWIVLAFVTLTAAGLVLKGRRK